MVPYRGREITGAPAQGIAAGRRNGLHICETGDHKRRWNVLPQTAMSAACSTNPYQSLIRLSSRTADIWKTADQLISRYGSEAADIATLRAIGLGADRYSRYWFDVARAIRDFFRHTHVKGETVN